MKKVLKRILACLGLFVLMLPVIYAPTTPCTTVDTTTSTTFTNVSVLTDQSITFGGDETWSTLVNLTPTDVFNFTNGYYENWTLVDANNTNSSLIWPSIDAGSVVIQNATNGVILGAGNYTIYATDAMIWWNLTGDNNEQWNYTTVSIYYNKSFLALQTDLVAIEHGYTEGAAPGYGETKTWQISRDEIAGNNWTMFYTYTTRTCSARDSCLATRVTIFAGFALLAVAIVVLSAFAIIKLISGDMTGAALGVLTVSIIGLGVVIMIGYYITSTVGTSVCNAAVG